MSYLSLHPTISLSSQRGFTLIEMMVVIAIILSLASISFFPYTYYMQRASVERSVDTLGQSWVLAHKDIRNGKMYDINTTANKLLVFRVGSPYVEQYLYTGTTIPLLIDLTDSTRVIQEKNIDLDSSIHILSFSGAGIHISDTLIYSIQAPYGVGMFSTGADMFSSTGVFVSIGYDGASIDSGRARQILLRPYLQ